MGGLLVALHVEPPVGHVVVGEERLHLVALVRPPVPDHAYLRFLVRVLLTPAAEQVVDDGVEPLVGRVPRLQQVVVEPDVVDGLDRDTCVGVRREQQQARLGRLPAHLLQQLDPRHPGHALVGDDEGDRAVSQCQLRQQLQCLGTGGRAHHLVVGAVARTQVARDRTRYARIVIDRQNGRLRHLAPLPAAGGVRRGSASAPPATQGWCETPADDKCASCQAMLTSSLTQSCARPCGAEGPFSTRLDLLTP